MKKNKKILIMEIMFGLIVGSFFGILGIVFGAFIGGNYGFFEFGGFGGYEAGGIFFGLIGFIFGNEFAILKIRKRYQKNNSELLSLFGCIIAFSINYKLYNIKMSIMSLLLIFILPSIIIILILELADIKNRKIITNYFKKRPLTK